MGRLKIVLEVVMRVNKWIYFLASVIFIILGYIKGNEIFPYYHISIMWFVFFLFPSIMTFLTDLISNNKWINLSLSIIFFIIGNIEGTELLPYYHLSMIFFSIFILKIIDPKIGESEDEEKSEDY
jgi:hypothetical protein